jgi:5-keto 4-deoxyuronate isomerase
MAVTDTPLHVRRRLVGIYASMTGAERVVHAMEMAEEAKAIAMAGIRARHPEWSDAEAGVEWLRLLHGDEIADRVARCSSSS